MKVAVACQQSRLSSDVAERFGRTPFFLVYDTAASSLTKLALGQRSKMPPDGGLNIAVTLLDHEVEAVISGKFGNRVAEFFQGAGVVASEASDIAGSFALDRFLRQQSRSQGAR